MAEHLYISTAGNKLRMALSIVGLICFNFAMVVDAAEQHFFISIPTLTVATEDDSLVGTTGIWAIQIDRLSEPMGLVVQSEIRDRREPVNLKVRA